MASQNQGAAVKARSSKDAAPDTSTVLDASDDLTEEQLATLGALAAEVQGKPLLYKIGWVKQHVGAVAKTGQVAFGSTKFAHMQEHGLIGVLRPLLRLAKLDYIGGCMSAGAWVVDGNQAIVDYALTVFDMETGEEITRWYPNTGVDSADKGFNKAYTGAMKYALQKFFAVPTDDIDDNQTMDVSKVGGTKVAAEVRDINSAKPAKKDVAELRATLGEGVAKKAFTQADVKNKLTAEFGVAKIDEIASKADFKKFAEWVVDRLNHAESNGADEPEGGDAK